MRRRRIALAASTSVSSVRSSTSGTRAATNRGFAAADSVTAPAPAATVPAAAIRARNARRSSWVSSGSLIAGARSSTR